MDRKSISFRIDEDVLKKIRLISKYYGRSTNKQVEILFRSCISKFEKEHGEIIGDNIDKIKFDMINEE